MAKALKIAAGVVAIAGLALITGGLAAGASLSFVLGASSGIAGLSVAGLFTASALLNAGASLLSPKPKAPDTSQSNADRLTVSINTRAPRVTVVGSTAMATDLRDQEWSADQSYLHRFVVAASHRVAAIREIWFDDKLAWSAAGGVQAAFAGFLSVTPVLEGSPANAINIGARMGSSRRYTGLAYVYLSYKLSKNGKTDSPFASSIPSRMTIVGDGASFYDPRLDSTVPGGSGPMRAGDQSTWAWNPGACRNPALAMLFYLLGWRIQNPVTGAWKLAVGKGIPAARIDLASFITAANLCDESVARADGSFEPRYRCDGVWSEQDDPSLVLDNLKATMNAVLDDVDGKIRVTVLHNDLGAPIGSLSAADVMGAFTWTQTPALSDCVNVLRGGYTDPSSTSLYQLVDFPEARIDSPDGIDRAQTLNLPLVQSPSQAQRLIKTRLQRAQYPGSFQATFLSTAWRFQKGDVVEFSFYPLGWDRKLFRIADMATQVDGQVPMLLREEHASIYAFDGTEVGAVHGTEPTRYDPALWPLVQGIVDAGKTADWPAISGEGKPADNADVTGNNTAKDTNAVGGKPSATVLSEIEAARARVAAIDNETIPAINKAVSDANDRITATRRAADDGLAAADGKLGQATVRLDGEDAAIRRRVEEVSSETQRLDGVTNVRIGREVATLTDADTALGRRIDSLVAQGGYDDTYLRGEISRVDQAAITREGVISRRIDTVSASFTRSGGNLLTGTDFSTSTLDGWTLTAALPATALLRNGTGGDWTPGGIEDVMTVVQNGTNSNPGTYSEVSSAPFAVRPGGWYQFFVFASSHRSRNWITLFYYDVNGTYLGYAGEFTAPNYNNGGRDIRGWDQNGSKSVQVPATAVYARMVLRKYDTLPSSTESVAWFWHPYVGEAREGQTEWNPYVVGTGRAVQLATSARITEAATTAADAKESVARLSTSVDTRFTGVTDTLGTYDQRITTLSNAQIGFASRATALEATATVGTSVAKNDQFAYWPDGQRNPTGWIDWAVEGRYTVERVAGSNTGSPYAVRTTNDANASSGFYQPVPVSAGLWVIEVTARREAGSLSGAGVTLSGIWNLDFLADPDINGQIRDSRDGETRTWTKTVGIDDRAVVNLHAMQGWTGFGRAVASHYIVWSKLALRPAAPGDIAGVKNAADVAAVAARVTSNENAIADLPNRYAAASRTSTLEAQLNRGLPSALNSYVDAVNNRIDAVNNGTVNALTARIEDRATVIADAKAGAVAETVRILRSEYNGTAATVTQQAGTLYDVNYRTRSYWRTQTVAGNNRAQVTIFADENNGAGVDIIGNVAISGDLTVDGTVTARKFNGASMSRMASASWTGNVAVTFGQTQPVPLTLSLTQIPPVGRFVYEVIVQVTTNAGQTEYGTYNGQPLYTTYIDDGGLFIQAVDPQGHIYQARPNASETVLSTVDFVPAFTAKLVSRNYDSGPVGNGDVYRQRVSANYSITLIDLKVTWVAI